MNPFTIIKIGGKLLDDEATLEQVIDSFSKIKTPKILVHGGGKTASDLCLKLGIKTKMVDGRRITDAKTLEVATMVYAGLINKKIVSRLQQVNCNALGCSGADANLILAQKRPVKTIDYGFAGDIESVNSAFLIQLLEQGITPVFCAITHDGNGQLLNTNADTIASALASALSTHYEVDLKFCFEKKGVLTNPLDEDSCIPTLSQTDYQDLREKGIISDGMIPKLDNAFRAKQSNVHTVMICGINGIAQHNGTDLCL